MLVWERNHNVFVWLAIYGSGNVSKVLTILNRILSAVIVLVILILLAVWAFSPMAVRYFAPPVLSDFGLEMDPASSIRFNPFKGAITIQDFALRSQAVKPQEQAEQTEQTEQVSEEAENPSASENQAEISYAVIDVSLFLLMANQLAFDELSFEDLILNVHRDQADDTLTIAGYRIENTDEGDENSDETKANETEEGTSTIAAWTLIVPALSIDNFTANIFDKGSNHQINLNELKITSFELAQQGEGERVSYQWVA